MEIHFEVESITPLFIAGANQCNIKNEGLRVPSVRGLMRWWFRAIMGSMTSTRNLQELEDKIFGSTKNKSLIKILSTSEPQEYRIIHPRKIIQSRDYLWFSIAMQANRNLRTVCYAPKSKFKISLISSDKNFNELKLASGAFWSLLYLGGIGSRMRRGAGSLKVLKIDNNSLPYKFEFKGKTINDAKNFIISNLTNILKNYKQYVNKNYELPLSPNFFVFSKRYADMALIGPYNSYKEGLVYISSIYQEFRRKINIKERYTLGLPIIDKLKRVPELKTKRFASPLFIGVMDLNGTYAIRLLKSYTSIHEEYSSNLPQLRNQLTKFDSQLHSKEVKIAIPGVEEL